MCGSLGTLLKARVTSSNSGTPEHKPRVGSFSGDDHVVPNDDDNDENEGQNENCVKDEDRQEQQQPQVAPRKVDLNAKVGSHIDKLDSLISKAENAQYSMKHQTKQMKAYMK